jgi:hypothetical protein
MLAGCLCCTLMPAFGKDAGWQWYNEKLKTRPGDASHASATTGKAGYSGETGQLLPGGHKALALRGHSVPLV